jgi:hypothetical protein
MSETTPSELDPTADNAESNPNAGGPAGLAGGMGVSSERVGPTGPGQVGTDGERDTSPAPADPDRLGADVPPEQQPGQVEDNPVGIPPKRTRDEDAVQGDAERAEQAENAGSSLDQPSG